MFVFLLPVACAQQSDFDKLCIYFKNLNQVLENKSLSKIQQLEFINKQVDESIDKDSPARLAWETVVYAMPDERYEIFKYTAEEVSGKSWRCDAMKRNMLTVGE